MNAGSRWLDPLAISAMAVALAAVLVALVVLPQRLAQRPARAGIITLQLARDGGLRLWNRPVQPQELAALLRQASSRQPTPVLRLIPDPDLPWGALRQVIARLRQTPLDLDVQLP